MNDKELLEWAAKAAGYDVEVTPRGDFYLREVDADGLMQVAIWNPLQFDGDALRLAVRLHIKILIGDAWSVDQPTGEHRTLFRVSPDEEPCQYAATRLAIVRAAAETAKQEEKPTTATPDPSTSR